MARFIREVKEGSYPPVSPATAKRQNMRLVDWFKGEPVSHNMLDELVSRKLLDRGHLDSAPNERVYQLTKSGRKVVEELLGKRLPDAEADMPRGDNGHAHWSSDKRARAKSRAQSADDDVKPGRQSALSADRTVKAAEIRAPKRAQSPSPRSEPLSPDDDFPDRIEAVMRAYLEGGFELGREAFGPTAGLIWDTRIPMAPVVGRDPDSEREPTGNRSFSKERHAATFVRDGFLCRYCGAQLVPRPLMALVSSLYPNELPFHKNYKRGHIHPAFWTRAPEADHMVAGARGGGWTDPQNHVTACVVHNAMKGRHSLAEIGWTLLPIPKTRWDGLVRYYEPVWERAGRPDEKFHGSWIRALSSG